MKRVRRWLAVMLAAIMALGCVTTVYAEPEEITVQLDVTYGQSEAREMLDMINEFRTGNDAWYWDEDNETQIKPTLTSFVYDYTLEQVAMQRAAEIVVNYSHTRPDGTRCFTALNDFGYTYWMSIGENIAIGYQSAEDVFNAWQETNENYNGQGHRRNMLNSSFNRIGIGHASYNGVECWVQEFAQASRGNTTETPANDQVTTVPINVRTDNIGSLSLDSVDRLTIQTGGSADLPMVEGTMRLYGTWLYMPSAVVEIMPDWTVTDGSIATIENGKLQAKSVGSTYITANVVGQTVTVPVTVTGVSLAGASVTLPQDRFSYNGKPIEPEPTVTLNGKILNAGTDYTVSYENNTNEGDATVIITGTGSYSGSVRKTFTITSCNHKWDEGVITTPAGCETEGVRTYTCKNCGNTRTESIPALDHDWDGGKITQEPTCTKAGVKTFTCDRCGDTRTEMIPALGHSYGAWVETKPATCTEEGEKTCTCTRCGDTKKEPIALLPHSWDDGVVTTEPTCKAEGVKTYTCMVCGTTQTEPVDRVPHTIAIDAAVEPTCEGTGLTEGSHCSVCGEILTVQEIIPAKGHNWDEGTITKEPTCTEDGGKTITCTVCGATRTEVMDALGHRFGAWETVTSPACTDQGSQKRTCERCGYTETQNINATGHIWESDFTIDKEPTCTVEGSKSIHCSKCDAVKDAQVIPALGHSWDEGKVTKEATCTETGEKIYTCTVCKDTYIETIPLTAHTLQWVTDKAATETEEGSRHEECSVCGWIGKTETIPALGSELVVTPNPDQNNPGNGEVAGNTPTDTNTSVNTNKGGGTATTAENTDQISSPDTGDHSLGYALTVMLAAGATILVLLKKKA